MQQLTLSVTQLNNYIKNIIDAEEILFNVSVYGEVSNFKISGANAYFDIKEEDAQLSCIKFGINFNDIKNGDKVIVTGRLNYHPKFGKLSFIVSKIELYGLGELYQKFLELKTKLEEEGIFDERHKKQIPKFSKCIGVVTSPTGAVIHDIIHVARKNNPFTDILIYPVKVQGEGAEKEIAEGIEYLDKCDKVDVIIVARGGGSFEDLAPFNTELVARAVYKCNKPIISGVGHETDFSLCDFASDLRAPTPSVAAEVSVFNYYLAVEQIETLTSSISYKIKSILNDNIDDINNIVNNITINISNKINLKEKQLIKSVENFKFNITKILTTTQKKLELLNLNIEKCNPLALLKKGYNKAYNKNGLIKSVANLNIGDEIDSIFIDGKVRSKIISIEGEN